MQDNPRATPRLMTVAAVALVAIALAAFAWIAGSGVAGAAGTSGGGGSSASGELQPVQRSEGQAAPDDRAAADGVPGGRAGHPCPEEEGGSGSGSGSGAAPGSSGQQEAPSTATPGTEL